MNHTRVQVCIDETKVYFLTNSLKYEAFLNMIAKALFKPDVLWEIEMKSKLTGNVSYSKLKLVPIPQQFIV